jgi:hypothetical protein
MIRRQEQGRNRPSQWADRRSHDERLPTNGGRSGVNAVMNRWPQAFRPGPGRPRKLEPSGKH